MYLTRKRTESPVEYVERLLKGNPADKMVARDMLHQHFRQLVRQRIVDGLIRNGVSTRKRAFSSIGRSTFESMYDKIEKRLLNDFFNWASQKGVEEATNEVKKHLNFYRASYGI